MTLVSIQVVRHHLDMGHQYTTSGSILGHYKATMEFLIFFSLTKRLAKTNKVN